MPDGGPIESGFYGNENGPELIFRPGGSVMSNAEMVERFQEAMRKPGPPVVLGPSAELTPLPRCSTCVHWEPGVVELRGYCGLIESNGAGGHGSEAATPLGDFGYGAQLETAATFGCTEHAAKPEETPDA